MAGLGRLIAAIMAVATMVFAILCIRAGQDSARLAAIGYYDVLPWLIFFDMAAMVLVNMRIAGVAHRGGFHRVAKFTGALMVAQVIGMLMLLAALNVFHDATTLTWTAAVPATMALCYLLLIFYFRARGGYKVEVLVGHGAEDEEFTGGTVGPGEG